MAQENTTPGEQSEPKVRVTKAQRNLVMQELMDECNRREIEMHTDRYASRDYSDGVRFEVGRLQQWLSNQMGK